LLSDPKSEIIDFYPTQFKLDINGAAYAWMGVNLLPFINRPRLLRAMDKADNNYKNLSPSEQHRNKRIGEIALFYERSEESQSSLSRFPIEKLNSSADKEDKKIESFLATFTSRDSIYGICKHSDEGVKLGSKVLSIIEA
jgi:5'-3' exoribonuclease 2